MSADRAAAAGGGAGGRGRLGAFLRLMRFHRPIGILLLLWPTLWALWIAAGGVPDLHVLAVFVAGVVLMRAAGCVVNDLADRDFDRQVTRTRDRPLATGEIAPREALGLFAALVALAGGLVLTLDWPVVLMALVAVPVAATYPLAKRWTHLPQFHLGVAFSWGIPMAFVAQSGSLPRVAWLLALANLLWTVAYDTQYAMVDRPDDLKAGVKSTAVLFGHEDRLIIGIIQLMALLALVAVGTQAGLGTAYQAGLVAAAGLGLYQQWLIRARQPAACFRAFLNNNWLGAAVFAGIALDYALG